MNDLKLTFVLISIVIQLYTDNVVYQLPSNQSRAAVAYMYVFLQLFYSFPSYMAQNTWVHGAKCSTLLGQPPFFFGECAGMLHTTKCIGIINSYLMLAQLNTTLLWPPIQASEWRLSEGHYLDSMSSDSRSLAHANKHTLHRQYMYTVPLSLATAPTAHALCAHVAKPLTLCLGTRLSQVL